MDRLERVAKKKVRREKIREGQGQKREDAGARKCRNVAKHCGSSNGLCLRGSKSRLAKAMGAAEPTGQMRNGKLHAIVAPSTFGSKKCQKVTSADHFWKLRCRKVHAVVVPSKFPSQNVQSTLASDHIWKLRCRKSATVLARSILLSQHV